MNKKDFEIFKRWQASTYDDIMKAYRNPSLRKYGIWSDIKTYCKLKRGYGLKVISRNVSMFTAGFMTCENGVETLYYFSKFGHKTIIINNKGE